METYRSLADCQEKNPEMCELYLVEEIGGVQRSKGVIESIKHFATRGRSLRIAFGQNAQQSRNFDNDLRIGCELVQTLMLATPIPRIIIMTDADVDGSHIVHYYSRFPSNARLVLNNHLYIASRLCIG